MRPHHHAVARPKRDDGRVQPRILPKLGRRRRCQLFRRGIRLVFPAHTVLAACWCRNKHPQTSARPATGRREWPPGSASQPGPRAAIRAHFVHFLLARIGLVGHEKKIALIVRQNGAVHFPRTRCQRLHLAARERHAVKMRVARPLRLKINVAIAFHPAQRHLARLVRIADPGPSIQASS